MMTYALTRLPTERKVAVARIRTIHNANHGARASDGLRCAVTGFFFIVVTIIPRSISRS